MNNYKTYDCFPYDGEEILDLRFKVLFDHVDYFIIGESNISFSGKNKKFKFDINKYKWAKKKIRYYQFFSKDFANCNNAWDREMMTRNLLINGLYDCEPNDRILLSDCDEIFDPDKLQISHHTNVYCYDLLKSHFYGDYVCLNNPIYRHPVSFSAKLLKNVDLYELRHSWKNKEKKIEKFNNLNITFVKKGGWHFSYFGDYNIIFDKISKFPDDFLGSNYNQSKVFKFLQKNKDLMILKGIDIYLRENIWGRVDNFRGDNLTVFNWFQNNNKYLAPIKIRNYGSVNKYLNLYYFLDKKNSFYVKLIKFILKIRNKFFFYFKIKIF